MKNKLILPLLLIVPIASANEYQTFINLDYTNVDTPLIDLDSYSISAIHFFEPKESLGPLGEFEYINTTNNIFSNYRNIDNFDSSGLGGELFLGNVLVAASFNQTDDFNVSNLSLGYLVNDDFLVKARSINPEQGETVYFYSAQYAHQLGNNNYIGFTYETDENFDNHLLSGTYFTSLGGGKYFKANLNYSHSKYDDYWSVDSSYYFNDMTSVSLQLNEDNDYGVNVEHFLSKRYAVKLGYFNGDDVDSYQIGFTAQF